MRRAAVIIAMVFAALALAFASAFVVIFHTGMGRAFLIAEIEKALAGELGGEARIGALSGAPPGRVIAEDLVFSDAGGPWLTVERVEMDWRPLRLLRDEIDIDRLRIGGAHLLREPPDGGEKDNKDKRLSLRLPDDLPALRIADLALEDFRSDLGGATARLDGVGAVDMGGRKISAALRLTSEDERDLVDVTIERAPRAGRFFIDATVIGAENGVIAAFVDVGGPLYLELHSDGPAREAVLAADGAIGAYGEIRATLAGDIENLAALDIAGEFRPGPALAHVTELAGPLAFDMRLEEVRRGGRLMISRLNSTLGALEGTLEWMDSRAITNNIKADLKAVFAADYRTDVQRVVGDAAALNAVVRRRGERYAFEATLDSDRVHAVAVNGLTDFDALFSGDLTANFKPREDVFFLDIPLALATRFDIDLDDTATFGALAASREDGSSAAGAASFRFADEVVTYKGDIHAGPGLVASLIPSLAPADFVDATVDFSGPIGRFTLKADIDAPAVKVGDGEAPPLDIKIALAGLPNLPTGDVSARAQTGPARFDATFRSSEDGRVALPRLEYAGEKFALDGSGAYAPQSERLEVDLAYRGEDGAEPWPGVVLEGAIAIKGALARQAGASNLAVASDALRLNDMTIFGLNAEAKGPPNAVETAITAARFETAETGVIDDLALSARIDLKTGPTVALRALSGVARENAFSLLQPASIAFADGVAVDGLHLKWGEAGDAALDGAFTETRWRAKLALKDANVPGADGRVTLDLNLDTDAETPARGDFRLRSLLAGNQEASISGALLWDGRALVLSSAKDADAIDMRLSIPALLERKPALGLNTNGALDGYARYDGAIEIIAAYLPPDLQTMEGSLKADFKLGGTLRAPSITGVATVTDGAYTELQSGVSIAGLHVNADASLHAEESVVRFLGGARGGAQTGEDTISLSGELALGETTNLALAVGLDRVELSAYPVSSARASGRIDLSGPLDAISATGTVIIDSLNAEIPSTEDSELVPIAIIAYGDENGVGGAVEDDRPRSTIDYDIQFSADDRIFIRGRGLESEWSADVNAASEKGETLILGAVKLRRGALDFAGRRFELTKGSLVFDRLSPNNPRLDISAEHNASGAVTAVIAVTGRADAPSITLSSTPPLPSEDVMALVLFGKPANELTALESLQTAEALAALGGIGPFGGSGGVTSRLRSAVGLDLLNIDLDPETGGSLTVGKYVADGLFVSATQDARGESGSVRIQYEITDNITIETEVEQAGDQTVSANWKRDF